MSRTVRINGQVWPALYRPGAFDKDGRWVHGGFLLLAAPDGSLPPANEAGADPVEVEAARLAGDVRDTDGACRHDWNVEHWNGWDDHMWGGTPGNDRTRAGWLARQIVEEE